MQEVLITSLAVKLFVAVAAIVIAMALLRRFDKMLGINFKTDVFPKIAKTGIGLALYHGFRFFGVMLLIGLVLSACSAAQAAGRFTAKFDRQIQSASSTWLPGQPWKLWKAQLYQESLLTADAVSPAGAVGIAQFMPGTWDQVLREMGRNPALVDRRLAGPSIEAGAFYMAKLKRAWVSPRPEEDRIKLAQASYNAGMGNILRSQQRCGNPSGYEAIMACLHLVTGRHAAETRGYAPAIFRWWALMEMDV
ncbi:MAG: transglycosylase SLT domain-containing protein [Reyranellaceae bacterium]